MYEPTVRLPSTDLVQEKLQREEHGICHEAAPPAKVLLATDSCRERQSRFLLRVKATYIRVYEQHIFCLMVFLFSHMWCLFFCIDLSKSDVHSNLRIFYSKLKDNDQCIYNLFEYDICIPESSGNLSNQITNLVKTMFSFC